MNSVVSDPTSRAGETPALLDDCDVLIVGGGPVGLLLASLLGARGVKTTVCEKRRSIPDGSLAIGVTPPSLEILKPLGLDDVFSREGVQVRDAEVHEESVRLGRLNFRDIASEYRFFLSIPQQRTTELLQANLARFPSVTLRFGVEFVSFHQDSTGVQVKLRKAESGAEFTQRCRFLIGCDGHRSPVRASAGLRVREKQYWQRFIMGDFADYSGLGSEAHLFFTPHASVESFPLPGGLRRWIVLANERGNTSSGEYLVQTVRRLAGHDLSGQPILFLRPFGARRMEVESYHRGRVLLAGDAAHVMSSIGGQGMNTGFADAEMLADLLPRVLQDEPAATRCFRLYDRVRRSAFRVAAGRAARGMWLGTLRGRAASRLRKWFIRDLLFSSYMERRLAPHFAMLTIPFRNLKQVPHEWWPASVESSAH